MGDRRHSGRSPRETRLTTPVWNSEIDTILKSAAESNRIAAIDQLRGYAIFGMILVNFLGHFDAMPWTLKHHHYGFSYADSIAPLFIFIVGLGFRMSFQRRAAALGTSAARRAAVRRYAILIGLGLIYGGFDLRAGVWDALMDIGCAGMLTLLIIDRAAWVRIAAATLFLSGYQAIFTLTAYGQWVVPNSIDGGPLGPLSWVFIFLMGTLAHDLMASRTSRRFVMWCCILAVLLGIPGWLLRLEWPGIKAEWPFTQYGMSAPYPIAASGLCFLTLAGFYALCDMAGIQLPHLTVLGRNPLVLYLVQAVITGIGKVTLPATLPASYALCGFAAAYALCYGVARTLHRKGIIVKI